MLFGIAEAHAPSLIRQSCRALADRPARRHIPGPPIIRIQRNPAAVLFSIVAVILAIITRYCSAQSQTSRWCRLLTPSLTIFESSSRAIVNSVRKRRRHLVKHISSSSLFITGQLIVAPG